MLKKYWLLISLVLVCGCATPPVAENPLRLASVDYDALWEATMAVLEERFEIKEADKDAGLIVTEWKRSEPLFGGATRTAGETLEETLNIVRRRATAKITCENAICTVALNISRERGSFEAPRTSPSEGYSLYNPTVSELSLEPEEGLVWIDLGRDKRLEGEILAEISEALR